MNKTKKHFSSLGHCWNWNCEAVFWRYHKDISRGIKRTRTDGPDQLQSLQIGFQLMRWIWYFRWVGLLFSRKISVGVHLIGNTCPGSERSNMSGWSFSNYRTQWTVRALYSGWPKALLLVARFVLLIDLFHPVVWETRSLGFDIYLSEGFGTGSFIHLSILDCKWKFNLSTEISILLRC
jgi:hypothetical protein